MITKNTFKSLLQYLEFSETDKGIMEKNYLKVNAVVKVDFNNELLIYPEVIEGRDRNDGFDKPENFVVFECVCRLLEKGYRPEHIELEKEWHLGHVAKGGRADICVYDSERKSMLLNIECKTWGAEFDKAWKDTINDGGQIFSYWQQEGSCKWIALYTSDFINGELIYKSPTINCTDDPNIVKMSKRDKTVKIYLDAHSAEDKFEVWRDTYSSQYYDRLIFLEDTVAYKIGLKPLQKKDLKDFTPEDKVVNRFEEILRHNNVSDKENAFNRLVALFICKLVDEITKSDNDEVDFQYKVGTDDYESLQDRLQRLHQRGMKDFMQEEILYVENDYAEKLFSNYTGSKRKKAIEDLNQTIRILKFYSNNDFAFKDVHNEELFYQNGKILVEVVQLFEEYRIVYPSKHQFLGDLFEQLLNKGFKQNEGQFFTPVPITRFIWDSLPIDSIACRDNGDNYPRIIDYACGAGHFLTEGIEAINDLAGSKNNSWVRNHIYGIEKDYRLARVSKISLFMNGAGEGNIIFGDGLENDTARGIANDSFDILVANPPYSVSGFKAHLQLKNNTFELLDRITMNGSEIEVLFVERIAQLLKPKGIAAVILPSSILSNDSLSYTGAREQILQNFMLRAIVQLGGKTFSETDTTTVILFLEKYDEPPKKKEMLLDSVNAIFSNSELSDWEDQQIYEGYLSKIEVDEGIYKLFLEKTYSITELEAINYLKLYVTAFADSTDTKKWMETKSYKNMSKEEQNSEYLNKFYEYAHALEKEKMFYFSLVYRQSTVVIISPKEAKDRKEFLGYEWSKRKGSEGIHVIKAGGKMYDASNRKAEGTLANAIKKSFEGIIPSFSDEQEAVASTVCTKDMLNFLRPNFNKAIRVNVHNLPSIKSKYDMSYIRDVLKLEYGKALPENMRKNGLYPVMGSNGEVGTHNEFLVAGPTIIVGRKGSAGSIVWENKNCYPIDTTYYVTLLTNKVLIKYVYYILEQLNLSLLADTMGVPGLNRENVYDVKIPVPPISVQQQIIDECEKTDSDYKNANENIKKSKAQIQTIFDELGKTYFMESNRLNLIDSALFEISIGRRMLNSELDENGTIPVYSANVFEPFGYTDELLIKDFSRDSILWGIDGDWMVNYIRKGQPFYPTDHCGVLRVKTNAINSRYMAYLLEAEGEKVQFSRSYRASTERIQEISVMVPPREEQDKCVEEVLKLDKEIAEANEKLKGIKKKRAAIVEKYL